MPEHFFAGVSMMKTPETIPPDQVLVDFRRTLSLGENINFLSSISEEEFDCEKNNEECLPIVISPRASVKEKRRRLNMHLEIGGLCELMMRKCLS